jgi:Endomembrane protein 70
MVWNLRSSRLPRCLLRVQKRAYWIPGYYIQHSKTNPHTAVVPGSYPHHSARWERNYIYFIFCFFIFHFFFNDEFTYVYNFTCQLSSFFCFVDRSFFLFLCYHKEDESTKKLKIKLKNTYIRITSHFNNSNHFIQLSQLTHFNHFIQCKSGGVLPFGACFVELFFIMSSIWMDQYYYVFGFLLLVYVILGVTCAEITIVLNYFQLCSEG